MGDVSDAMRRAMRERGGESGGGGARGDGSPGGDGAESGALPIDEVAAAAREGVLGDEDEDGAVTAEDVRVLDPAPAGRVVEGGGGVEGEGERKGDGEGGAGEAGAGDGAEAGVAEVEAGAGEAAAADSSLNGYSPQIVVHHDRGSALTEQYRAIRTQILARGRNRTLRTHVITSSAPAEGKSVTSVNIGVVFSELRSQKTVLVECDLRRPTFGKLLGRDPTPGMLQLLRGEIDDLSEAIHPTVYDNLQYIPAGGRDHINSTELLSSPRMTQIIEQLKDRYTHIFVDSPPVVTVTDAAILGAMCDETLLVVRLYKTPVDVVDRAKRLLRANNCEVTGVILTHMKIHMPRYLYRYGYGYGYGYGYTYTYK